MNKRANELNVRAVERPRGGEGTIRLTDLLTESELCGAGRMFACGVLPPGASVGEHEHIGEYEAYYILSGEAEVLDDGASVRLGAGDVHICPNGHRHALKNVGRSDLKVLMAVLKDRSEA